MMIVEQSSLTSVLTADMDPRRRVRNLKKEKFQREVLALQCFNFVRSCFLLVIIIVVTWDALKFITLFLNMFY